MAAVSPKCIKIDISQASGKAQTIQNDLKQSLKTKAKVGYPIAAAVGGVAGGILGGLGKIAIIGGGVAGGAIGAGLGIAALAILWTIYLGGSYAGGSYSLHQEIKRIRSLLKDPKNSTVEKYRSIDNRIGCGNQYGCGSVATSTIRVPVLYKVTSVVMSNIRKNILKDFLKKRTNIRLIEPLRIEIKDGEVTYYGEFTKGENQLLYRGLQAQQEDVIQYR